LLYFHFNKVFVDAIPISKSIPFMALLYLTLDAIGFEENALWCQNKKPFHFERVNTIVLKGLFYLVFI